MAVRLHEKGLIRAKQLIKEKEVEHCKDNWEAHKATRDEEVHFLNTHSMPEYGEWFLGIDTDIDQNDHLHYVYPHGDFKMVHREAIETAAKEAAKKGQKDIENAAKELLSLIDRK